jgi:hypothetical protein
LDLASTGTVPVSIIQHARQNWDRGGTEVCQSFRRILSDQRFPMLQRLRKHWKGKRMFDGNGRQPTMETFLILANHNLIRGTRFHS